MAFSEPAWWYVERQGFTARLLLPASWIVDRAARWRFERTQAYGARLPVVCIGNFTAGGAGKTPLALFVCELLQAAGERPVFLSRGYGGKARGPRLVDPAHDQAAEVGDEPLLLARAAPTIVARDRAAGARLIEGMDASVIVMDDGLQNPQLAKNLSLAVVDGVRGLGNGAVMPAGPLRSCLGQQLPLIDAIILNGGGERAAASILDLKARFKGPVLQSAVVAAGDTEWLTGRSFVAYAGIGAPHRFFATAERYGARLCATQIFPDHHQLTEAEAGRLLLLAEATGAALLTTEKDWVRLQSRRGAVANLRQRSEVLTIRAQIEGPDRARLAALLKLAVQRRRAA